MSKVCDTGVYHMLRLQVSSHRIMGAYRLNRSNTRKRAVISFRERMDDKYSDYGSKSK